MTDTREEVLKKLLKEAEDVSPNYWIGYLGSWMIEEGQDQWMNNWSTEANIRAAKLVWDVYSGVYDTKLAKVLM